MVVGVKMLLKNEFVRNVFSLFTWNALGQAITLVSIPILTRIYTPEEFGAVALFISIINVFSIAANGRYDMAIVLPKRDGQAFHLLVASILIALFFSLVSIFVVFIFFDRLTGLFKADIYKRIIWLLPLCIFLVGSHQGLNYWFNRKRSFKMIGMNKIIQNASQTGIRLGRELFTNGNWGLVIGFLVGEILAWSSMVFQLFKREFWRFKHLSLKTAIKSTKEYINFPLYLMPMGILNALSVNMLVFALSVISSSTFVGHYERSWRVISFPLSLISTSFGSVFYEKMNRTVNRRRFYLYSYFGNLLLALLILFPIAFWGEAIFSFVLGSDWAVAGQIAKIILPLTIFNFATQCVSTIFSVIKKNQILLIWQIVYLALAVGWIAFSKEFDLYFLLKVYSLGGAFMYILLAYIGFVNIDKVEEKNVLSNNSNSFI